MPNEMATRVIAAAIIQGVQNPAPLPDLPPPTGADDDPCLSSIAPDELGSLLVEGVVVPVGLGEISDIEEPPF